MLYVGTKLICIIWCHSQVIEMFLIIFFVNPKIWRISIYSTHNNSVNVFSCLFPPQLIDYAKKGDTDEKAMKMASFWLTVSVTLCPSVDVKSLFSLTLVSFSSGKGSGPKALQASSSKVWDSVKWLHTDGAHPQQTEPWQSQDGRPGV